MRNVFHFDDDDFTWETFKEMGMKNVVYSKHSFYTTDYVLIRNYTDYTMPEDFGLKVFKDDTWQDTGFYTAAVIQNIFWQYGLAPKVERVLFFGVGLYRVLFAHLVEHIKGDRTKNIKGLERVAEENFITINYGGGDAELDHNRNWIDGKYIDFGRFKIDKDAYVNKMRNEGKKIPLEIMKFIGINNKET